MQGKLLTALPKSKLTCVYGCVHDPHTQIYHQNSMSLGHKENILMKKVLTGVLGAVALALILATSSMIAYASDIRVRFNGEYVDIYPAPFIEDGRTLVPARAIAEMLGAIVEWDEENRQVSIEYGDIDILLAIDSNIAVVNGMDVELDVPAMLIDGRTFVPLRFVAESLGVGVEFEEGWCRSNQRTGYLILSLEHGRM